MDTLSSILGKLLQTTPNFESKKKEIEVLEAWPSVVGERVARHAWAVRMLDDGVLLVAAESSAWLQNLRYLEPQIVEKFARTLGRNQVRGLRFKLLTRAPE